MKRLLVLLALALAAALPAPSSVEATHDGSCSGGVYGLNYHPDQYWVECDGAGKGWVQVQFTCYYLTWVVENGVVVDSIKHYKRFYSEPVFKPWYVPSVEIRVRCTNYRPYMETRYGLGASVLYWHGS